MSNGIVLPVVL